MVQIFFEAHFLPQNSPNVDSFVVTNIKLGDDFLVPSKGKGIVPILTKKNEKKFIHDVFYVLHLKVNLISIG